MSGIAGIIRLDENPVDSGQVLKLTAAMQYRGPDAIEHWQSDGIALGHCLMRTTPESAHEQQPYVDPITGNVIVFAGRLDGRATLLRQLELHGATPEALFDAALVVRAYSTFGDRFLDHIDGDFAFLVWDPRTRAFVLARDRLGITPLHYWHDGHQLVFASDLHAILNLGVTRRRLNIGVVAEILADRWMLGNETLWEGICTLRPGTYFHSDANSSPDLKRYWPRRELLAPPPPNDDAFEVAYRDALESAISDACRASTPITFSVSGGLDSSALLCVAERMRREGRLTSPATVPCTLDYSKCGDRGEIEFARAACHSAQRPLAEFAATVPDGVKDLLRDHCATYGALPGYLHSQVHRIVLQYAHSQGSRVLVTGEGGDNLWSATNSDQYEALRRRDWTGYFRAVKYGLARAPARATLAATSMFVRSLSPIYHERLARFARRILRRQSPIDHAYWLPDDARRLLQSRSEANAAGDRHLNGADYLLWPSRSEFFCQLLSMFELVAAVQQIEVRHPYLTRRLVELSAVMPQRLKAKGNVSKLLHRNSLQGIVPEEILARTDKCTADVTTVELLAQLLVGFEPSDQIPFRRESFDKQLRSLLTSRRNTAASPTYDLWALMSLWLMDGLAQDAE